MRVNRKLLDDLRWFMELVEEPPTRIHVRGVWHDETGGSVIGTPQHARDFAKWIEGGDKQVQAEYTEEACLHPRRVGTKPCPDCSEVEVVGFDDQNEPITTWTERGVVRRAHDVHRWPMRAAMAKVRHNRVKAGFPDLARTLSALARSGGDPIAAAEVLAVRFPVMGDPEIAVEHFAFALARVRSVYSKTPIPRPSPERSEAQLNAEAEPAA